LREWTHGYSAGWYLMAGVVSLTLAELLILKRYDEKNRIKEEPAARFAEDDVGALSPDSERGRQ